MKHGYTMVRRLKLTDFELRVLVDALNARRLKQRANRIDNTATSDLIVCSITECDLPCGDNNGVYKSRPYDHE